METSDRQKIEQINTILDQIMVSTGRMSEKEFLSNDRAQDLITASLQEVVKLAGGLSGEAKETPGFPSGSIEGLKNILNEALYEGDDEGSEVLLWETIEEDIPFLFSALKKLLET